MGNIISARCQGKLRSIRIIRFFHPYAGHSAIKVKEGFELGI